MLLCFFYMKLISPAKINHTLKVLGKRPDGFHELETEMQAISLCDTIEVVASDSDAFNGDETNLVVRARELFRKKTGIRQPVAIQLEKRIPMEAGLGGGSSNAATTLFALNQLAGGVASESELQEWSAEIGSDIPFFFSLGRAVCRGRGERVENRGFEEGEYWVVMPGVRASTREIFSRYRGLNGGNNDLEPVAMELLPVLSELKHLLQLQGFEGVQMSGSGSAFFCRGEEQPRVNAACYRVQAIQRQPNRWYELA